MSPSKGDIYANALAASLHVEVVAPQHLMFTSVRPHYRLRAFRDARTGHRRMSRNYGYELCFQFTRSTFSGNGASL